MSESSHSGTSVSALKKQVSSLLDINSPLVTWIKHPIPFIDALSELDGMIEMDEIKIAIVRQIQFLIVSEVLSRESTTDPKPDRVRFDGHMLHTAITGSPGVGKTKIGIILSKIWSSLGFLGNSQIPPPPVNETEIHPQQTQTAFQNTEQIFEELRKRLIGGFELISEIDKSLNVIDRKITKAFGKQYGTSRTSESVNSLISGVRNYITRMRYLLGNSMEMISVEPSSSDKRDDIDAPIAIAYRTDLVGQYQGQSAIKTRDFIRRHWGKVIFIDEAYQLYNGDRDSFGLEALTTLVQMMSEHPSELVVIIAGYRSELFNSIFRVQPGLYRRMSWFFDISGYTSSGLAEIFIKQLSDSGWSMDKDCDVKQFFTTNIKYFEFYGGDTLKLAFYCKLVYSEARFMFVSDEKRMDESSERQTNDPTITKDMLKKAFKMFMENTKQEEKSSPPPPSLYL